MPGAALAYQRPPDMPICETYIDGTYHSKTGGTWHLEDSLYKANQVLRMLDRHPEVELSTICDIGCGAGGVLAQLERRLATNSSLVGYDLSPEAMALADRFRSSRCTFRLEDPFEQSTRF